VLAGREEISRGLVGLLEFRDIAAWIGRDASVVSREVARDGGRDGYRAVLAESAAVAGRSRPKVMAVDRSARTRSRVVRCLVTGRGIW